ncbi:MAG: 50S ribosomal protein L9 [Alphaproteobacteria bacterium]|nr:50S ribosomal protein L9 [Alphaproteobacteria bacterium]
MQVILLERIEKLGQMGDEVTVKPGFARNYLLPQGKALRANKENRAHFDQQKAQLEADNLKRKSEAEQVAGKIDGLMVTLVRQASEMGNLYGSVTARDIAEQVVAAGFTVEKRQIIVDKPIKSLGIEDVRVQLHPEVSVVVKANVARSLEEAEMQAQTGQAIVGSPDEREDMMAEEEAPAEEVVAEEVVAEEFAAEDIAGEAAPAEGEEATA